MLLHRTDAHFVSGTLSFDTQPEGMLLARRSGVPPRILLRLRAARGQKPLLQSGKTAADPSAVLPRPFESHAGRRDVVGDTLLAKGRPLDDRALGGVAARRL